MVVFHSSKLTLLLLLKLNALSLFILVVTNMVGAIQPNKEFV